MFKLLVLACTLAACHAVAPYHEGGYHHDEPQYSSYEEHGYGEPHYSFAYSVHDSHTGDYKSHKEERKGDYTQGVYSLKESDGGERTVEYSVVGKSGFNAKVIRGGTKHEYKGNDYNQGGYGSNQGGYASGHAYGSGHGGYKTATSYASLNTKGGLGGGYQNSYDNNGYSQSAGYGRENFNHNAVQYQGGFKPLISYKRGSAEGYLTGNSDLGYSQGNSYASQSNYGGHGSSYASQSQYGGHNSQPLYSSHGSQSLYGAQGNSYASQSHYGGQGSSYSSQSQYGGHGPSYASQSQYGGYKTEPSHTLYKPEQSYNAHQPQYSGEYKQGSAYQSGYKTENGYNNIQSAYKPVPAYNEYNKQQSVYEQHGYKQAGYGASSYSSLSQNGGYKSAESYDYPKQQQQYGGYKQDNYGYKQSAGYQSYEQPKALSHYSQESKSYGEQYYKPQPLKYEPHYAKPAYNNYNHDDGYKNDGYNREEARPYNQPQQHYGGSGDAYSSVKIDTEGARITTKTYHQVPHKKEYSSQY